MDGQHRGSIAEAVWDEIRSALRQFRYAPGFAAAVVLILALGIGANIAIFSVLDNLLLRPPNFDHFDRLVHLFETHAQKVRAGADVDPSPGNFLDWREASRSFDYMVAWRNWYCALAGPGTADSAPESVRSVRVSSPFFTMLGVKPTVGDDRLPRRQDSWICSARAADWHSLVARAITG